jgi:hypothetical protein
LLKKIYAHGIISKYNSYMIAAVGRLCSMEMRWGTPVRRVTHAITHTCSPARYYTVHVYYFYIAGREPDAWLYCRQAA